MLFLGEACPVNFTGFSSVLGVDLPVLPRKDYIMAKLDSAPADAPLKNALDFEKHHDL